MYPIHQANFLTYSLPISPTGVRHPVADVVGLPTRRFPRRPEQRTLGLHPCSHHPRTQLRHHPRDAPQQETLAEARRLHHGRGLDLRPRHGPHAPARGQRLQKVRGVLAVRDRRPVVHVVRRLPHSHQWSGFSHAHGVLSQDVLGHSWIAGKMFFLCKSFRTMHKISISHALTAMSPDVLSRESRLLT